MNDQAEVWKRAELAAAAQEMQGCSADMVATQQPCRRQWRGVSYSVFGDLSAGFDTPAGVHWSSGCSTDKMTDAKSCHISAAGQYGLALFIVKTGPGTYGLAIGGETYPGTPVAIRIDKGTPYSANEKVGFGEAEVKAILNNLKSAQSVVTRYYKWPQNVPVDNDLSLAGFSEVMQLFEVIYHAHVGTN